MLTLAFDKPSYLSGDTIIATYSDVSSVITAVGTATVFGQVEQANVTATVAATYDPPVVAGLALTWARDALNPRVFSAKLP